MKLTIGMLVMGLAVGTAWGQNTDAITNTRDTMKAVQQKQVMDQNAALGTSQALPSNSAPSASKSAAAAKPSSAPKPKVASAAKPASKVPAQKPEEATITIVRTPKVAPTVHVVATPKVAAKSAAPHVVATSTAPKVVVKAPAAKVVAKTAAKKPQVKAASKPAEAPKVVAVEDKKSPADAKKEEPAKKINLTGRRDPFISPVVNRSMVGSGCSTGKRCLAIDQIALRGVVKSDSGMIAVVTNALDKAYFLHENDPVFNGYVVKITGDSIVFKESVQDKMGKPFMREVTKTISTPAV